MALGSTHPLTEMSSRKISGFKGRLVCKADKFNANCEPIFQKILDPRLLTTLWSFMACCRDIFTLPFYIFKNKIHWMPETKSTY
jgi:hypothetical protein